MNTGSSLQRPLLFGVYDPNGEITQMHKSKILGKTRQVLLYKSKQVQWEHRREWENIMRIQVGLEGWFICAMLRNS